MRDSWASWNPQRQAAHQLQQLVQSGHISLQHTIAAQRQTGSHSKHEPFPGSIPAADAEARGWVGHPKPFAWPAAKDAQVGFWAVSSQTADHLCGEHDASSE